MPNDHSVAYEVKVVDIGLDSPSLDGHIRQDEQLGSATFRVAAGMENIGVVEGRSDSRRQSRDL